MALSKFMGLTVLQTKLQPPLLKAAVSRPRLYQKLDQALAHKLTLVAAPAGFGKTTLVAEWLNGSVELGTPNDEQITRPSVLRQAQGKRFNLQPYSWLSLDENDNELRQFLAYLVAAWQKIDRHVGQGLVETLRAPGEPNTQEILATLLNDLAAVTAEPLPQHALLVLDDFHVLDNPQIDQAMAFLLDYLPANAHLILISRIDPSLSLARLRARREVIEIRQRDLRFTAAEAAAFFDDIARLNLAQSEVQALCSRTEGWIAGLQLAAVALQSAGGRPGNLIAEVTGSHRYIMDYLTDEVFQRQTPAVQHFLLETSLLNRMCASLCDAVRQRDDSQAFLEQLERSNLFIVPLDEQRQWYRYHHLFADLLGQRRRGRPSAALHQRASDWYATLAERTGDGAALDEAFHHAVATSDPALLVTLLQRFGDSLWEGGEHDKLRRWLARLPAGALASQPRLNIFRAWLAFTGGQYTEAEASLAQAEAALASMAKSRELYGRIAASRAFIATFKGDTASTLHFARQALDLLDEPRSTWRSSAAIALGDAYSLQGQPVAAEQAYQEALASTQLTDNPYLSLNAGFKLAATLRQRGRLHQAHDTCTQHIALAEQIGLAQTALAGCLYALRGDILCEWNRLPEAMTLTQQGVEVSGQAKHLGLTGWIYLYRLRCLLVAQELAAAGALLRELDALAPLPPWIAAPLATLRALLWLAQGRVADDGNPLAFTWPAERGLSLTADIHPSREFEYLTFARILVVQGQLDDAGALLQRLLAGSRRDGRTQVTIVALVMQALIAQAQERQAQAVEALAEALRLGEPGAFLRTFLDAGPPLIPLLKRAVAQGIKLDYARRLLDAFTAVALSPAQPDLPEPLSEREVEVLRLIAAGLKNQEIADRLIISLNTVLYHTKNIYSKLGVDQRLQAANRARELNLL